MSLSRAEHSTQELRWSIECVIDYSTLFVSPLSRPCSCQYSIIRKMHWVVSGMATVYWMIGLPLLGGELSTEEDIGHMEYIGLMETLWTSLYMTFKKNLDWVYPLPLSPIGVFYNWDATNECHCLKVPFICVVGFNCPRNWANLSPKALSYIRESLI